MNYNEQVRLFFFYPQHVGVIDEGVPYRVHYHFAQKNNYLSFDLYIKCDENQKITKACFKAMGNPYLIAGLEWICKKLENTELISCVRITIPMLAQVLGMSSTQYPIACCLVDAYTQGIILMKAQFKESL